MLNVITTLKRNSSEVSSQTDSCSIRLILQLILHGNMIVVSCVETVGHS